MRLTASSLASATADARRRAGAARYAHPIAFPAVVIAALALVLAAGVWLALRPSTTSTGAGAVPASAFDTGVPQPISGRAPAHSSLPGADEKTCRKARTLLRETSTSGVDYLDLRGETSERVESALGAVGSVCDPATAKSTMQDLLPWLTASPTVKDAAP